MTTPMTNDNELRALLPCPFCGTKPYLYTRDGSDLFVAVRCNGCGATSADFRNDPSNPDEFTGEPAAIAAWNRRALAAAPAGGEVDALREDVEAMVDRMRRNKTRAVEMMDELYKLAVAAGADKRTAASLAHRMHNAILAVVLDGRNIQNAVADALAALHTPTERT